MADFPRITVRSPQPFDIVRQTFALTGLGRANEGVVGVATVKDKNGTVVTTVSPMFVPNSGFWHTMFDFPVDVGVPATAEGVLVVEADNPSGLPQHDFTVTVPLTFGDALLGADYEGFQTHKVVARDTLSGLAEEFLHDATKWPLLFTANRDRISDPDLIKVGQVLRIPVGGP